MRNHDVQAQKALLATLAGQGVAALGILIQWVVAPELFGGFPPGLLFIFAACVIVWFDRRATWSPAIATALSVWIIFGGVTGGQLTDNLASGNVVLIAGNVVMLLGLLASAATGIVTIVRNRRSSFPRWPKPLGADNPRRLAVIVTVVGLLMDAIGDGAPEGLNWDGPGPVLFAGMAVLVALVPGRTMPALAALLSAAFVVGVFTNPEPLERLANPGEVIGFGFQVLQLIGLIVAVIGGVAALLPGRNRSATGASGSTPAPV